MKLRTKIAILLSGLLVPCCSLAADNYAAAEQATGEHAGSHAATPASKPDALAITAEHALEMLKDGNIRFQSGASEDSHRDQSRRCDTFANGQHPVAAVLACADSRAPVELIFDQGIGDVFTIRVAGNVADTDEIGTIEYGIEHLKVPLIVVLGHTKCSAVTAVVDEAKVSKNIEGLVDNIVPAVKAARTKYPTLQRDALIAQATRMNVQQSMRDLVAHSDIIKESVEKGTVKIVGAVYDLHSGSIEWLGEGSTQATLPTSDTELVKPAHEPPGDEHKSESKTEPEKKASAEMPHLPVSRPHNFIALGVCLVGGMVLSVATMRFVKFPGKADTSD